MYKGAKYIGLEEVDIVTNGLMKRITNGDIIPEIPEWEAIDKVYFEPVYEEEKKKFKRGDL